MEITKVVKTFIKRGDPILLAIQCMSVGTSNCLVSSKDLFCSIEEKCSYRFGKDNVGQVKYNVLKLLAI